MRFIFYIPAILVSFASVAIALEWTAFDAPGSKGIARATFSIPCSGCLESSTGQPADEALVFDFALHTPSSDGLGRYTLNARSEYFLVDCLDQDQSLFCEKQAGINDVPVTTQSLDGPRTVDDTEAHSASYTLNILRSRQLTTGANVDEPRVYFHFHILTVDEQSTGSDKGFIIITTPGSQPHILDIVLEDSPVGRAIISDPTRSDMGFQKQSPEDGRGLSGMSNPEEAGFNIDVAMNELRYLEQQLAVQRHRIAQYLQKDIANADLSKLLETCDGLLCKVTVLFHSMCNPSKPEHTSTADKSKVDLYGTRGRIGNQVSIQAANEGESDVSPPPYSEKHHHTVTVAAEAMEMPITITKSSSGISIASIELPRASHPALILMECLAAVLGLIALFAFVRKRCMSLRKRVEREADKEERRNARAYRRAARRALWRKRWQNLTATILCSRSERDDRNPPQEYEEKRAQILQQVYMKGFVDLDLAEKGELMDAEIRELRSANEIVAKLVRNANFQHVNAGWPVFDPPPPMVPLPQDHTPGVRSRASTQTLPSYTTSEGLPDYTSTIQNRDDGTAVTPGFTSLTEQPSGFCHHHVDMQSTGRTRYTPNSSIIELSPRASAETLRTRFSKDSEPVNADTRDD